MENIIRSTSERAKNNVNARQKFFNDLLKTARLKALDEKLYSKRSIIERLHEYYKPLRNLLHDDIIKTVRIHNDLDTAAFLSQVLEKHEKINWMLESHLS